MSLEPRVDHYQWLDKHLNDFWIKVFGKSLNDSGFGGVVSAHGDKAYGYKRRWENAGIPFPHGVAVFFLLYTDLSTEEDSMRTCEWVIEKYPEYKKYLPEIDFSDSDILSL